MFLKDKLIKGGLKLNTNFVIDEDESAAKPPRRIGFDSIQYFGAGKSSIEFDGTDSIIEGTQNHFKFGTSDFSISCWFYIAANNPGPFSLLPASGTQISVLSKYKDANNYWGLEVGVAELTGTFNGGIALLNWHSKIGGVDHAGGQLYAVGSGQLTVGWHHLVITHDRSDSSRGMKGYIDGGTTLASGGLIAAQSGGASDLDVDGLATIGLNVGANSGTATNRRTSNGGQIADLRSYDRVLTEDEIITLRKKSFHEGAKAAGLKRNLVDHVTFGDRDDKIIGKELDNIKKDTISIHGFRSTAKKQKEFGVHRKQARRLELVSNQKFDTDLSGWTQTGSNWTQSSGKAVCSSTSKSLLLDGITTKIGHTYFFTFDVAQESGSAGYVQTIVGSTTGSLVSSLPTTISQSIRASSNNLTIGVVSLILVSTTVSIDNISIQEVATTDFIPKNFASTAFKKHRLKGGILE